MPEKPPQSFWKRRRKWIILGGAAFALVAFIGVRAILKRQGALPEGIVAGQRPDRRQAGRRLREGAAAGQGGPRRRRGDGEARSGAGAARHRHAGGRSWPRPRRPSPPRRSASPSPRPPSSSRRARSTWPRSRPRARSAWWRRAPARSGISTSARTKLETTKASLARGPGHAADRDPERRGGEGERGDHPDPHRRRHPEVAGHGAGPLSPGRARRGPARRRQGADAGEPGGHLHGDLPPLEGGGRPEGGRRGADHRRLRSEARRRRLRQLRLARGPVHPQAGRDAAASGRS